MTAPGWRTRAWCKSRAEVFDEYMPGANQLDKQRDDVEVSAPTIC